jgi:hypothetical protein
MPGKKPSKPALPPAPDPRSRCYHCKALLVPGVKHACPEVTEASLTQHLNEDLAAAWERLRESAAALGEQRIYASHNSIMFARKTCYAFVRPKKKSLELVVFLPREVTSPHVRRVEATSKTKWSHTIDLLHRDQVEAPLTDWLAEAYAFSGG